MASARASPLGYVPAALAVDGERLRHRHPRPGVPRGHHSTSAARSRGRKAAVMSGPQDNLPPVAASPENTAPTRRRDRTRPPRSTGPSNDALPRLTNRWAPLEILTPSRSSASSTPRSACSRRAGWRSAAPRRARIYRRAGGAGGRGDADGAHRPRHRRELPRTAPERFVLHARNPARDLHVGGNVVNFGPVNGAPNVTRPRARAAATATRSVPRHPQGHPPPGRAALAGRRGGRARRRARADAAPRHLPGPYRVLRHRLGRARRRRRRRPRTPSRCRRSSTAARRGARRAPDADDGDQRQFAAPGRRGDPRQHHDHGRATANASCITPVHADGRHGAGDAGGRADAADGRGARHHRAVPDDPPRRALRDGRVHLERGHAHRLARLRHAGISSTRTLATAQIGRRLKLPVRTSAVNASPAVGCAGHLRDRVLAAGRRSSATAT